MQALAHIGIAILTGYIAFTNLLAGYVTDYLPEEVDEEIYIEEEVEEAAYFTKLESFFSENFSVPDFLLTNNSFQGASVVGSSLSERGEISFTPEEAMVNIYCTYTTEEYIRATTGSGFFINRHGAILTNAHVAQFLLLENAERPGDTVCTIRTGNPATSTYEAKLLYIPPTWVKANANLIEAEEPRGTGERDYALLYVTERTDSSPLPASFPHVKVDVSELKHSNEKDDVTAYGYPAGPMYENGVDADLPLVSADSSISHLYTFDTNTADLLAMYDSSVSQGGSSGGPVFNTSGNVIGVISTQGETSDDSLRAITTAYINRTIKEETGFTLAEYTSGDLARKAAIFESALSPFLTQLLEFELEENKQDEAPE